MSAKMKSNKRTPRIKPCKARGVDSKGSSRCMYRTFRPIGSAR